MVEKKAMYKAIALLCNATAGIIIGFGAMAWIAILAKMVAP